MPDEGEDTVTDVVVVGAGIVGAAVAYEVAKAGAAVTLVERSTPASGVTGDSFAWIGGPRGNDAEDGSRPLRVQVVEEWRRLEREVPELDVRWTGSLSWAAGYPPPDVRLGEDECLVDVAGVNRLEPRLAVPPARALHRPTDAAVDPVAATEALVRAAQRYGTRLLARTVVTGLPVVDERVAGLETSRGFVPASRVVLAAGTGTPALCSPLGLNLPVESSPALLLRASGPPGLLRTVVAGPEFEARQSADGELLVALAFSGEADETDLRHTGERALRRLATALTGADDLRLRSVRIGTRPVPVDGLPVVGSLPSATGVPLDVSIAVMHSGVSLAPVVGRLLAGEVVLGRHAHELDGVRPDRF